MYAQQCAWTPPLLLIQPLTLCQLTREYKAIAENPPPYITAHPSESNILEYVYTFSCPRTRCAAPETPR